MDNESTPPSPPENNPRGISSVLAKLPTNLVRVGLSLVIIGIITLINCVRSKSGEKPIPIPEIPDFVWPDGIVSPGVDGRNNALKTLRAVQGFAEFSETEANQLLVGNEEDIPLYRFYASANGSILPSRDQKNIGSCVSFGYAGACELRIAVQYVTKKGGPIQKVPHLVQEAIYGTARVDVNGGSCPIPFGPDGRNDGACGAWAVKALSTYGLLERKQYQGFNLSEYSVSLCKEWGDKGLPAELKPEAKKNLCTYALIRNCDELLKSIQIGCPVAVCSSVGFGTVMPVTRDSEGRLRRSGNWGHCMFIAGYRADIKCFLIVNSWGSKWVNGPKGKYDDIPDGSFWADWDVVNQMLNNNNDPDSYAISGVNGFKRTKLKPEDWAVLSDKQNNVRRNDHAFALSW